MSVQHTALAKMEIVLSIIVFGGTVRPRDSFVFEHRSRNLSGERTASLIIGVPGAIGKSTCYE